MHKLRVAPILLLIAACGGTESDTTGSGLIIPPTYESIGEALEAFGWDAELFFEIYGSAPMSMDLYDPRLDVTLLLPRAASLVPFYDQRTYLHDPANDEALREILLHHFVPGPSDPTQGRQDEVFETALDDHPITMFDAYVSVEDAGGGVARFTSPRIGAGVGGIVFLDEVLVQRRAITDGIRQRSPLFARAIECVYPLGITRQPVTFFAPPDTVFAKENIDPMDIETCRRPGALAKIVHAHQVPGRIPSHALGGQRLITLSGLELKFREHRYGIEVIRGDGSPVQLLESTDLHTEEGVVHELSGGFVDG